MSSLTGATPIFITPTSGTTTWYRSPLSRPDYNGQVTLFVQTLSIDGTPVTSITVRYLPTLIVIVSPVTLYTGGPAQTVGDIAYGLPFPYVEIIYTPISGPTPRTDSQSSSTPGTNSQSSPSQSSAFPTGISVPISSTTPTPSPTDTPDTGIGAGAIAGIAIAGIVILALIIGGWYFWRRKKRRTQPPTNTLTDDELARREGDGDKMVLGADQAAPTTGAYQTQYQEMSGNGLTQELDRSHSYKYAIGGAHELRAEDQPGELPYNGMEEHGRADEAGVVGRDDGGDGRTAEMIPVLEANNPTSRVSPHVEAQRKREVEWLEMEETRMRQRREALLQQGGGQHT